MPEDTPVTRLSAILPLADRQRDAPARLAEVHRTILHSFAATGRPCDVDAGDATALSALDLVVLDAGGSITGAYPFTLEHTEHLVTLPHAEVHAMCSLDAVAIAPMFGVSTRIDSQCAATGAPIVIEQDPDGVGSASPESTWLGIRWQQTHGCAAQSLCREMVFFIDEATARAWQNGHEDAASVFSLEDGIRYGAGFFGPLVQEHEI